MNNSYFVRCGDWSIRYQKSGDGPPLVFLHGGSPGASGMSNFSQNVKVLARSFTTYVLDFPGWGESSKNLIPSDSWANPLEAGGRVVVSFLEALGIEKAHLLGSSFGASAALYAAMIEPQRIDRLVLLAPGGGIPATTGPTTALVKLLGYYLGDGPTLKKFTELSHHLVHDKELMTSNWLESRYLASIDPEVCANPPLRMPPGYIPQPSQALCNDPRLSALAMPTLFIWGKEDEVQPLSCLESFRSIPNQDSIVLGLCGHLSYWEQADKVNELALWHFSRK